MNEKYSKIKKDELDKYFDPEVEEYYNKIETYKGPKKLKLS